MGIVNSNYSQLTTSPQQTSITLSGTNRAVVVLTAIKDTNPADHSAVFDVAGVNKAMTALVTKIKHSTQDFYVYAWYLLDADLPANGTYNVDVTWTLSDSGITSAVYALDGVSQSIPEDYNSAESNATTNPSATVLASAAATVMDLIVSTENNSPSYTVGAGQTELFESVVGTSDYMSSYATGETTMSWSNTAAYDHLHVFVSMAILSATPFTGITTTDTIPVIGKQPTLIVGPINVTDILVNKWGVLRGSLSNLKWAWFDVFPTTITPPTDSGTAESTDASGNLRVNIPNSTLLPGQTGWLIFATADGTWSQAVEMTVQNNY